MLLLMVMKLTHTKKKTSNQSGGFISVKGNRGFWRGVYSIDFTIIDINPPAKIGVGLATDDWEPQFFEYLRPTDIRSHQYCYWSVGEILTGDTHIT